MKRIESLNRRALGWIAIALGALCLLAFNVFSAETLRFAQLDLTANRLYTITEGTRRVMSALDEPIRVRLYFSKLLGDRAAAFQRHAERVKALLDQYAGLSRGRLSVELVDPEPFTAAEDRAVAAGLQGVPLGGQNETGYFGLVASNTTDNEETIAFFSLERERFLEYDLTKLVHKLANPKRKVVGLLTSLPIEAGFDPQTGMRPGWLIIDQIRDFYDLKPLEPGLSDIPAEIDALLLVQPTGLKAPALRAIDQFVLKGKPALVFIDPLTESGASRGQGVAAGDGMLKLLEAWGAKFDPGKVVADQQHARRIQFGSPNQPVVASYLVWLLMGKESYDEADAMFVAIDKLAFATAGAIEPVPGAATRFHPLVRTGLQSRLYKVEEVRTPDPLKLLRGFVPENKPLTLAARLTGDARAAFPEDAPKETGEAGKTPPTTGEAGAAGKTPPTTGEAGEAAKAPPTTGEAGKETPKTGAGNAPQKAAEAVKAAAQGRIDVMVIADSDLLYDNFWVETREILGQRLLVPRASNADLLLSALEALAGGEALAGLRGRGVEERPFTRVEQIRRDAEARYRRQEQALNQKLDEVQKRIGDIQSKAKGDAVILAEEDKRAILDFRQEMLAIRQELRGVQRALRQDIDQLDFWLKFANIAGAPLLIGIGGAVAMTVRRRRHGGAPAPLSGEEKGKAP